MRKLLAIAAIGLLLGFTGCAGSTHSDSGAAPVATPNYHIEATWPIGGEGGWDYLMADVDNHRLYVSRGSHVQVLDTDSGQVVADIPSTPHVHGVGLAPLSGATSNGDGSVVYFDRKTDKVLGVMPLSGTRPDAIIYDANSNRMLICDAKNGALVSSAPTNVVATVYSLPLGGKPEFLASDGAGHVYVNLEDQNQVAVVDTKEWKVTAHWSVDPGDEPAGMAMDPKTHRLFIGCHNKLMVVMDSNSGKVLTTLPIGSGVDACAFDPATHLAFASCGDGTLTVIHEDAPDKFTVTQTVQTLPGARTMAVDTRTHMIYLATADFGPAPAPTPDHPHPRPPALPGTFKILVVAP